MSGWTDERVATLKQMHADGEVVPQIAQATGMTPGAVSGKLFRLGLCTRTMNNGEKAESNESRLAEPPSNYPLAKPSAWLPRRICARCLPALK